MPGKVLAVMVAPGDHVDYGQQLLTLEAMKMAQSIRSPRAGSVVAVLVTAGDTVRQGQPMVTLE
jgi:biotin carboxyl carrier protein